MRSEHLELDIQHAVRTAKELSYMTREEYIVIVQGRRAQAIRRAYFNRNRRAFYGAEIIREGIRNF